MNKGIHVAQFVAQLPGDISLAAAFQPGDVRIGHLGIGDLLRMVDLNQAGDPFVGNIHHGGMNFDLAAHYSRLVLPGKSVEDRGFSSLR